MAKQRINSTQRNEKVLFSGTPAASVTLSETSANFSRMLVFFLQNGQEFSTWINGTTAATAPIAFGGLLDGAYRIRVGTATFTPSGTTLSVGGSGTNYSTDTTSTSAVAFSDVKIAPTISKVIGFRD